MNTISLWQPFASLIAHSLKCYETRSWKPPDKLIGHILGIHAARRWTLDEARLMKEFVLHYPDVKAALSPDGLLRPPLGAILCACRLVAVYRSEDHFFQVDEKERAFGDWSPGRFVWKLEVVKLPPAPIPVQGKQGIWNYNP